MSTSPEAFALSTEASAEQHDRLALRRLADSLDLNCPSEHVDKGTISSMRFTFVALQTDAKGRDVQRPRAQSNERVLKDATENASSNEESGDSYDAEELCRSRASFHENQTGGLCYEQHCASPNEVGRCESGDYDNSECLTTLEDDGDEDQILRNQRQRSDMGDEDIPTDKEMDDWELIEAADLNHLNTRTVRE